MVVADTQVSVRFYQDVLGLELCNDRPTLGFPGAWFTVGEQQIHLLEVPNPDSVDNRPEHGGRDRHLALSVDNLTEIEQLLIARSIYYTKSKSGRQALFFRDPDGNGIELIQQ
ncbi:MAG: glyoxalase [endosymbiont of Galathealinum brachiosum]|uniref:Glyoxalase n=1 Tax=endosymbiont of Galathealinum brachiosum TaxID=2200906 RepID=A0A370DJI2_9GAMM|nr:MAG: glyoxalase [endosymbiont of Galathealinum brachiosum]